MLTHFWHKRKRWNNRGFSSVVGAVFMVLIVATLASAYFTYTLSQNTSYNEAVRQSNLDQLSYQAESINVTSQPTYTIIKNGTVGINVDLQNDGSVAVQIRTLWVHGVNSTHYGYIELSTALATGQNVTIKQNVTISGVVTSKTANETFYGWIVTSRGKTINLYPAHQTGPQGAKGDTGNAGQTGPQGPEGPPSVTALVSQGIGSISLDFKSFRVFTTDYQGNIQTTSQSFTFSRSAYTGFSVNVTNLDPSHLPLNLTSISTLWIFSPASGAIKGDVWGIATLQNNRIAPLSQSSSPFIIFPYNQTTTLYFGPTSAGSNSLNAGITGVNLILTGKIGNIDYGQNLPFISLVAT